MKPLLRASLIFVSGIFVLLALAGTSSALDEGGCLTCHQYPGFVRLDAAGKVTPLQVEEAAFFASAHGKLRCRDCHTGVAQVPHTGETAVTCSTAQCHTGQDAKVLPADVDTRGFHRAEQSYVTRIDDATSCRVCHPLYPHSADNLVRGFLNLHTGFLFCNACHIKREAFSDLTYDWENTENATFAGKPFGTAFNPRTTATGDTEHFLSRISAFTGSGANRRSLANTADADAAREFERTRATLSAAEQQTRLDGFHRESNRKTVSVACAECHSAQGILDFEGLGFAPHKIQDLRYLNLKGLVTKYKIFYFPKLFGQ